jgi:hypothetical protein
MDVVVSRDYVALMNARDIASPMTPCDTAASIPPTTVPTSEGSIIGASTPVSDPKICYTFQEQPIIGRPSKSSSLFLQTPVTTPPRLILFSKSTLRNAKAWPLSARQRLW